MKVYHLRYNPITGMYLFVNGRDFFKGQRLEVKIDSERDLLEILSTNIDLKRNSEIHVLSLPEDYAERVESFFKDSKVIIKTLTK